MCHCQTERQHLINAVDSLLRDNGERWAVIENRGGNLEVIPEISLKELTEIKIIYQLK